MTLESIQANLEDLERIQRLTTAGYFAPWFPAFARHHAMAYTLRIWLLKIRFEAKPYPCPTVTER